MNFRLNLIWMLLLAFVLTAERINGSRRVSSDAIHWHVWNTSGSYHESFWDNSLKQHCDVNGKWAVLVHGW